MRWYTLKQRPLMFEYEDGFIIISGTHDKGVITYQASLHKAEKKAHVEIINKSIPFGKIIGWIPMSHFQQSALDFSVNK